MTIADEIRTVCDSLKRVETTMRVDDMIYNGTAKSAQMLLTNHEIATRTLQAAHAKLEEIIRLHANDPRLLRNKP